jgi:hypothetical protein
MREAGAVDAPASRSIARLADRRQKKPIGRKAQQLAVK